MSSLALTHSILNPDDSFDGASQMCYMEQCSPDQFDLDESDEWAEGLHFVTFPICAEADEMQAFLSLCVPDESDGEMSESQRLRLFCHLIIRKLPDSAFKEAVESLAGMYAYYRDAPLALPSPQQYQPMKARVTAGYTAPVCRIEEG